MMIKGSSILTDGPAGVMCAMGKYARRIFYNTTIEAQESDVGERTS